MSETQAFQRGDLVRIADDLGPGRRHFLAGVDAIVEGSYADQYGGNDRDTYTLFLREQGRVSWYDGKDLTLVERNRGDLRELWQAEREAAKRQQGDLAWIFAHGSDVLQGASGATVGALAACLGLDVGALWGSRGEGFVYFENAQFVLALAEPYIRNNDLEGWLEYAGRIRERAGRYRT